MTTIEQLEARLREIELRLMSEERVPDPTMGQPMFELPPAQKIGGSGVFDASLFVFGYSFSGAIDTVSKGYCQHSTRGTLIRAAQAVTIGADHDFVVLNYVFGSGALTLSLSGAYPVPEATIWRKPLHQCRLINGVASLEMFFPGNLEIPGAYA